MSILKINLNIKLLKFKIFLMKIKNEKKILLFKYVSFLILIIEISNKK